MFEHADGCLNIGSQFLNGRCQRICTIIRTLKINDPNSHPRFWVLLECTVRFHIANSHKKCELAQQMLHIRTFKRVLLECTVRFHVANSHKKCELAQQMLHKRTFKRWNQVNSSLQRLLLRSFLIVFVQWSIINEHLALCTCHHS